MGGCWQPRGPCTIDSMSCGRNQFDDCRGQVEVVEHDGLMAGSVAADEFHLIAGAIEDLRQQTQECCIGGGVHRRGGDFDAQFISERFADFADGRPRLKFDGQKQAAGNGAKEGGVGRLAAHDCVGEARMAQNRKVGRQNAIPAGVCWTRCWTRTRYLRR